MCFIPSFALDFFPTGLERAIRENRQDNVSGCREIRLHKGRGELANTYPARDPPIQGKRAGVNAGALPALAAAAEEADGGGAGSLTIAMDDASDLRGAYGS